MPKLKESDIIPTEEKDAIVSLEPISQKVILETDLSPDDEVIKPIEPGVDVVQKVPKHEYRITETTFKIKPR